MASKKVWKKHAKTLTVERDHLITANTELNRRLSNQATTILTLQDQIAMLESSPEIKADTEAAFRRGENHARRALRAWLVHEASQIEDLPHVEGSVIVEVPQVEPLLEEIPLTRFALSEVGRKSGAEVPGPLRAL